MGDYIGQIIDDPLRFCNRPFIQYSSTSSTNSFLLTELLPKFQPVSEKEAKVAVKALDELKLQTSVESILGYSTLCSSDYACPLDFFLEQLSQLPQFSKVEDMTSKLGQDCAKWVNMY